jgi:DNA-damage-inducible protein D
MDLLIQGEQTFEEIKHINEYGQEIWFARELQKTLDYAQWRNFEAVIQKAMIACESSKNRVSDHFAEVSKMITIGKGGEREQVDYELTRYACYLIVQNGDPKKEIIALGQTYFAIKTRQQEIIDNYDNLSEDQKRLAVRDELRTHNKLLADAAKDAGVVEPKDYAIFMNRGYQGLYGGLGAREIHDRKGLKKSQQILDHMGSEELAANLFRATQTDSKLRREQIHSKNDANNVHFTVGKTVRKTIEELGGTMPENLETPTKSIGQLETLKKKQLRDNKKSKDD